MVFKHWSTYFTILSLLSAHSLISQCLVSYTWDYTPQQIDGTWGNNETVHVCLILDHDDWQGGNHYLHALIPEFGTGWDMSTLETFAPISCSNDGGYWAWYSDPITSEASAQVHGAGFYYESPMGGTDPDNPGDNFGDRCPDGLQLEFCFEITTLPFDECDIDMNLDISVNTLSDDESGGAFLSPTCQDDEEPILSSGLTCCNAFAGGDLDLSFCSDGPLESINDYLLSSDSGSWHFLSIDNPSLGDSLFFLPGTDAEGEYLFVVTDTINDCQDIAFVNLSTQSGYSVGNSTSATICQNGAITYLHDLLGSNSDLGGQWTDPNGDPWTDPFSPLNDLQGQYTYSFPAIGSCPSSLASIDVTIISSADAGESSSVDLCTCQVPVSLLTLLGGTPQPNGIWTNSEGDVVPDMIDPSTADPGQYNYLIQNSNCADAASLQIDIEFVGEVGIGDEVTICRDAGVLDLFDLLNGNFDLGGSWYAPNGSTLNSSQVAPEIAESGNYTYHFDCVACGEESVLNLDFIETPTVSISGDFTQCTESAFELTFNSDTEYPIDIIVEDANGNQFVFDALVNGDLLDFSSSSSNSYTIIQAELPGFLGCDIEIIGSASITISDIPQASLTGASVICPGQSLDLFPNLTGNGPFILEVLNQVTGLSFFTNPLSNGEAIVVLPNVDTDYSILQVWDSSDSICTNVGSGQYDVNIGQAPIASIEGGGQVCGGGTAEALVTIEGEWDSYDITVEASFGEYYFENIVSGGVIEFPVPNSLTYCLTEVSPLGSVGCQAILQDTCMEFQVLPNLITYSVVVDCDVSTQVGTVSFTIQGGSGDYLVDGIPIEGNTFTSGELPNGSAFSFTVTDSNGCSTERSGIVECECLFSSAGEFPDSSDTLSACIGELIEITYDESSEALDMDDVRSFIIHDGESEIIGDILLTFNDIASGIGYFPSLVPDEVYWLTAIVANETSSGLADPTDVCLVSTTGVGIRFRSTPSAQLEGTAAICPGELAEFEIQFTGNGPWSVQLELDGNTFSEYNTSDNPLIVQTGTEGTYQASTISDQYCSGLTTGSVSVSVQELPTAELSGGGLFCEGSGMGPIVNLEGQGPWQLDYSINGNPSTITIANTPDVIPASAAGTYALIGVSDINCENSAAGEVLVEIIPAPQILLDIGDPVCEGDSLLVEIEFVNGNSWEYSYQYNEIFSDTLVSTDQNVFIYALETGSIDFLHLDNGQCSAVELPSGELEIYDLPMVSYSLSEDSICSGENIDLSIIGMNAVGTFEVGLEYNGEDQIILVGDQTWNGSFFPESLFNIQIGPIMDQVTGCIDSSLIQLSAMVIAYPIVTLEDEQTICSGDSVLSGSSTETGVIYQWNPSEFAFTADSSFSYLSVENNEDQAIDQELTLTADRYGCVTQENIVLTVDPLPDADFSYNPQPVTAVNPVINLYNLSAGLNTYIWTMDGDTISELANPSLILPLDVQDEYLLCLEATASMTGCTSELCDAINVIGDISIYIPNSFSPDGDGLNEKFGPEIRNADLRFYSFDIYDRGGSKVFSSNSMNDWWNGTENNEGQSSRPGVYNYVIVTRDKFSRNPEIFRGSVTLIR